MKLYFLSIFILFVLLNVFMCYKMITDENQFIVSLSSNYTRTTPLQIGNLPEYFYNYLPDKLNLSNEFEVSLVELSFDKSWNNINNFQSIGIEVFNCDKFYNLEVTIEPGYYQTIEKLLTVLNNAILSFESIDNFKIKKFPKFLLNPINKKIVIESGIVVNLNSGISSVCLPKLSKQLCNILGFHTDNICLNIDSFELFNPVYNISRRENKFILNSIESNNDFDLSSINWIYIYCDIIKPRIVGNKLEKLLGKIKIDKNLKFGEKSVVKFDNANFYGLNHFEFDHILIYLRDDKGHYIHFNHKSVTTLTLMFKKKYNGYKSLLNLLY